MKKIQRTRNENDRATTEKREIADKAKIDSRNRNDALTQERRFEADKTLNKSRARNDEITSNRREMKDDNEMAQAISFALVILVMAIGAHVIFFY